MDDDSLSKIQQMLDSEIEMISHFQVKQPTYKGVTKNLTSSFNKINVSSKDRSYLRRTRSFHQKTTPTSTRPPSKQSQQVSKPVSKKSTTSKPNLSNQNQVASDYVKYLPTVACEQNQLSLDDFLQGDSLLQNFGHFDATVQNTGRPHTHQAHMPAEDPQCSFRPMLLRKSLVIAQKMGDPLERLTKVKEQSARGPEYPFKPKVNRTPSYLCKQSDQSPVTQEPRWKSLYQRGQAKQQHQRMQREAMNETDLDEEHTFQPDISVSQSNSRWMGSTDLSFVERHNCWAARKQERIAQRTVEVENEKIQQCSFRPKLSRPSCSPQQPHQISEFGKKGWVEFFERVGMAKKQKLVETKQPGQNWKNQLTRPQPPSLLSRNKSFNSSKGTKQVNGKEAVAFFKNSGLDVQLLRRLWDMCSSNGTHLEQHEFYQSLKLIAVAQAGYEMSLEYLQADVPLPRFQNIAPPPTRNMMSVPPSPSQHMSIQRSQYDMTHEQWIKYDQYFQGVVQNGSSFISGTLAKQLFVNTKLHRDLLSQIWTMTDIEGKGYLLKGEFIVAIHLIGLLKNKVPLPSELPDNLLSVARGEPIQNPQRMSQSQQLNIQPMQQPPMRLGSNQNIAAPPMRRLGSNSNLQSIQPIQAPPPQRLGSNSSIQLSNQLGQQPPQFQMPVNPNEIPGWEPLQQQMNLARQQLGTVQSNANNLQLQMKELFDRILIEKQQEISTLQQVTNSYRMLLQQLQEQHNSFQVELSKLESQRIQNQAELNNVQQQYQNQQYQTQQIQQQYIQTVQQISGPQQPPRQQFENLPPAVQLQSPVQQQPTPYAQQPPQYQLPNQQPMRNSWDDIKDTSLFGINGSTNEPNPSSYQTYYPNTVQQPNSFLAEQSLDQPKGVLKPMNSASSLEQTLAKKQVHFSEPSGNKHDVTLGQIEVDLNKEFKGEDWGHEESNQGWGSWNAPPQQPNPNSIQQPQQLMPWQ